MALDLDWFVNEIDFSGSEILMVLISSYSRVIVGYRGGNNSRGLLNYNSREEYLSRWFNFTSNNKKLFAKISISENQ